MMLKLLDNIVVDINNADNIVILGGAGDVR